MNVVRGRVGALGAMQIICRFFVKGHLDYMRQMDTILVAVGVPTKEVPGASFALPQAVAVTKGTVGIPEQTTEEQQRSMTQNPAEKDQTHSQESKDSKVVAETEGTGDGWDIPDISDLLDCLSETESGGLFTDNATSSDVNSQSDRAEEAGLDNEQVSWSWDDTHWTTEHGDK